MTANDKIRLSKTRSRRRGGFTLTEMLVVLVILALLIALVAPNVINQIGGARSRTAEAQIASLSAALDAYRLDVGRYPDSLEALITPPGQARNWNGPYLLRTRQIPTDPWGNPYIYESPNPDTFVIRSLGRDGREGGEGEDADLSSDGR